MLCGKHSESVDGDNDDYDKKGSFSNFKTNQI